MLHMPTPLVYPHKKKKEKKKVPKPFDASINQVTRVQPAMVLPCVYVQPCLCPSPPAVKLRH